MKQIGTLLLITLCATVAQAQSHRTLTQSSVTYPITTAPTQASDAALNTPNSGMYPIKILPRSKQPKSTAPTYELGKHTTDTFVTMPYPTPQRSKPLGHTTRHLFNYQADTTRHANSLPMQGRAAQKSIKRYEDSFNQALPEWFEERVSGTKK